MTQRRRESSRRSTSRRLAKSRESRRHARLLQESLDQLPPWLAEALSTAIEIILRAARESKRRSGGRTEGHHAK